MTGTGKPLRQLAARVFALADQQSVPVLLMDTRAGERGNHRILYANAFAERLLGYSPGALARQMPSALYGQATDLFQIMRARDAVVTGARVTFQVQLYRGSGEPLLVDGAAGLVVQDRPGAPPRPLCAAVTLVPATRLARDGSGATLALAALQDMAEALADGAGNLRMSNRPTPAF